MRHATRLVVLAALAILVTACPAKTPDLLAKREWAAAREAARTRSGESKLAVDAWMRDQSSLVVLGSARELRTSWPGTEKATWPLGVHVRFEYRAKDLVAMGLFKLKVRARGVLWAGKPYGEREWIGVSTVWGVFGEGAKEAPWAFPPREAAEAALLSAFRSYELVCSTHDTGPQFPERPRPGDDHCEKDLMLAPARFAIGPPALFATALVQWPDEEVDALTWRTIEFRIPLPERPTLAESVDAALGAGKAPQTLAATPPELDDLE